MGIVYVAKQNYSDPDGNPAENFIGIAPTAPRALAIVANTNHSYEWGHDLVTDAIVEVWDIETSTCISVHEVVEVAKKIDPAAFDDATDAQSAARKLAHVNWQAAVDADPAVIAAAAAARALGQSLTEDQKTVLRTQEHIKHTDPALAELRELHYQWRNARSKAEYALRAEHLDAPRSAAAAAFDQSVLAIVADYYAAL